MIAGGGACAMGYAGYGSTGIGLDHGPLTGPRGGGSVDKQLADWLKWLEDNVLNVMDPIVTALNEEDPTEILKDTAKGALLRRWRRFMSIVKNVRRALNTGTADEKWAALVEIADEVSDELILTMFEALFIEGAVPTEGISLIGVILIELIWNYKDKLGMGKTSSYLWALLLYFAHRAKDVFDDIVKKLSLLTGWPEWLIRQFAFPIHL